jgi:hypothetical protein
MRDMWQWRRTGMLFVAGGLDDQPAERLHQMLFADKVQHLMERKEQARSQGKGWAEVGTQDEFDLEAYLYKTVEEDGR